MSETEPRRTRFQAEAPSLCHSCHSCCYYGYSLLAPLAHTVCGVHYSWQSKRLFFTVFDIEQVVLTHYAANANRKEMILCLFNTHFYWKLADPNTDIISKYSFELRSDSSGSGRCCQARVKCPPSSSDRDVIVKHQLSTAPCALFVALQSRRCCFCCKEVPDSKGLRGFSQHRTEPSQIWFWFPAKIGMSLLWVQENICTKVGNQSSWEKRTDRQLYTQPKPEISPLWEAVFQNYSNENHFLSSLKSYSDLPALQAEEEPSPETWVEATGL